MGYNDYPTHDRHGDADIVFSRAVKAGKRMYFFDVKRDRRGELYISMTESKRLKEQGDSFHPVFEKHKIFLYREDLEKFANAFADVAEYTRDNSPADGYASNWNSDGYGYGEGETPREDYKLDVEF